MTQTIPWNLALGGAGMAGAAAVTKATSASLGDDSTQGFLGKSISDVSQGTSEYMKMSL